MLTSLFFFLNNLLFLEDTTKIAENKKNFSLKIREIFHLTHLTYSNFSALSEVFFRTPYSWAEISITILYQYRERRIHFA